MNEQYDKMTKEDLIKELMKAKAAKTKGRKEQVLDLLKQGYDTIEAIANELGISTKNVSSQLTYLRKEGYHILSISAGGQSVLKLVDDEIMAKLLK
ncbi:MAG: ArsR family transcriptional regulator [Chloroflexi bacterium]|nr:MAG: ArsR family transcriptional regulator [Chloroflexota bacterium]